jgi:hypothetical protein
MCGHGCELLPDLGWELFGVVDLDWVDVVDGVDDVCVVVVCVAVPLGAAAAPAIPAAAPAVARAPTTRPTRIN